MAIRNSTAAGWALVGHGAGAGRQIRHARNAYRTAGWGCARHMRSPRAPPIEGRPLFRTTIGIGDVRIRVCVHHRRRRGLWCVHAGLAAKGRPCDQSQVRRGISKAGLCHAGPQYRRANRISVWMCLMAQKHVKWPILDLFWWC